MQVLKQKFYKLYRYIHPVLVKGQNNVVSISSKYQKRFRVTITGNNNKLIIEKGVYLGSIEISVSGDNNKVFIARDSRLYSLKLELGGDNNEFSFGINAGARELNALILEGRRVIIGDDSMFSYGVYVRTSDSHKIIDLETGERINCAKDVIIGRHCWIAQNVTLLKGTQIGDHTIVGFGSICTKNYPAHCIIAGIPARIIKENIVWDRMLH